MKGFLLVAFPSLLLAVPPATVDTVGWWWACSVGVVLLGLYLSYVGWAPAAGHGDVDQPRRCRPAAAMPTSRGDADQPR